MVVAAKRRRELIVRIRQASATNGMPPRRSPNTLARKPRSGKDRSCTENHLRDESTAA